MFNLLLHFTERKKTAWLLSSLCIETKVRITKSEISMRIWRSSMSAAPQGAFVVIPEISLRDISSPYNQVFFSINSILLDTCHWIELRLWSDLYLIQGRYTVIMGTPNKTSSLFVLNGLDVYPSLYGSSPLMSNRIIRLTVGPHFLRSACP